MAENTIPVSYEAVLIDNVLNSSTVLTPGTNYGFAMNGTPTSQGNARFTINLKTAGTLSVAENELNSAIQVWPNPAHNQFNITNNSGNSTIEISNLNGQLIHLAKIECQKNTTIQAKNWAKGVYILKASSNGVQTTKKIIIE